MRGTKGEQRPLEIAAEKAGAVLEAATRAESVARRLLRRTRRVARRLPMVTARDAVTMTEGHITLALPELPAPEDERTRHDEEQERRLIELRARAERAEQAAAWLRARLRAERARRGRPPALDGAALAAELTRELARLHTPHPDAIRRVVVRALAAQGVPAGPAPEAASAARAAAAAPAARPREQHEMLAKQVLARAPEVADPSYVYRILSLLEEHGRLTLPQVIRAAGIESAMARRRLRLAVEALTALGALRLQDSSYTLNAAYRPAQPERKSAPRRG